MARIRIEFRWPQQHRVVFIGSTGESLLKTYVAEDDINVYVGPRKKVNIWVAIVAALSGRWGVRGYYRAFLRVTKPKFVLTFEDNALEFYLTKMFYPSCITACIQNGRRDTYSTTSQQNIWESIRQVAAPEHTPDIVFSHGEPWSTYYRSALGNAAQVKAVGSVRNNAINLVTRHESPRVLFVSSFPNLGPAGTLADASDKILGYWQAQALTFGNFYRAEGLVAAAAAENAKALGLKFCVLGKRPAWQQGEMKYYENILRDQPWDYLPAESKSSTYERVFLNDIIVNIDSTFGYEMFARGIRVAFIGCRMQTAGFPQVRDCEFAYPLVTEPTGVFWTQTDSPAEIQRVVTTVASMSISEWDVATRDLRASVMPFDPGNRELCSVLTELGIKTHGPRTWTAEPTTQN
jgi:surface carbohydrate biosynthesis protein